MAEDIKGLIEKIQEEGIKVAEEKAAAIEHEARKSAEAIIAEAKGETERLLRQAKEKISQMEEAQKKLLVQAGRDLLLSLRSEIHSMLDKVIAQQVREALTPEALTHIIAELIRSGSAQRQGDMAIALSQQDLKALENDLLAKLKDEMKKGVILRGSEELRGGFTISFDGGKSQFDFTDKALAEYIGTSLKPKLNQLLQEAVKEK